MAYLTLNPGPKKWATPLRSLETLINYGLIVLGIFVLGPGVYVSRNFPTWYCLFKLCVGLGAIHYRQLSHEYCGDCV